MTETPSYAEQQKQDTSYAGQRRIIGFQETLDILDKDPAHNECHTRCSTSATSLRDIEMPLRGLKEEDKVVST